VNHRTTLEAVADALPLLATNRGEVVKAVVEVGPS